MRVAAAKEFEVKAFCFNLRVLFQDPPAWFPGNGKDCSTLLIGFHQHVLLAVIQVRAPLQKCSISLCLKFISLVVQDLDLRAKTSKVECFNAKVQLDLAPQQDLSVLLAHIAHKYKPGLMT